MSVFKGLTTESFAAYSAEKWASNVHNLTRMRIKEALLALCDEAQKGLEEELAGLARAASDEIPNIVNHKKVDAQWVFWFRDGDARKSLASFLEKTPLDQANIFNLAPQDKHVSLAVVLREKELWVGLWLAPSATIDRRNLAAKLGQDWARDKLLGLLAELPEGAMVGPTDNPTAAGEVTSAKLEELSASLAPDGQAWIIGHGVEATEAVELGVDLCDHVRRWLGVLAPFYTFTAWSRDNDLIEATRKIQEEKAQKRRQATNFDKGDKVRIVSGLFSGKRGVVVATDAKAQVRVRVGNMSVVVSGNDIVPV